MPGLHGGMAFTYRNPARSTDPDRRPPGCRSSRGRRRWRLPTHRSADRPGRPPARPGGGVRPRRPLRRAPGRARSGRRPAAGRRLAGRVVVDDNALVDREAAYRAGLGWYGKNANLLLPGRGSWFVLGSVLTTAPLPADPAPVADGCGACRRCIDACPTGAIVGPGRGRRPPLSGLAGPGRPATSRSSTGTRSATASTAATTARRSARSTAAATRRRSPRRQSGGNVSSTSSTCWRRATTSCWPGTAGGTSRAASPRYLRRNALVVLGNVGRADDPEVAATLRRYLRRPRPACSGSMPRWAARSSRARPSSARRVKHLLVTNDFPPKIGGIQSYLWELWRRLPPDDVTVLTTPHAGCRGVGREPSPSASSAREQQVLLPTRALARRIDRLADEVGANSCCSTRRCRSAGSGRRSTALRPRRSTAPRSRCPAGCPAPSRPAAIACCGGPSWSWRPAVTRRPRPSGRPGGRCRSWSSRPGSTPTLPAADRRARAATRAGFGLPAGRQASCSG